MLPVLAVFRGSIHGIQLVLRVFQYSNLSCPKLWEYWEFKQY